MKLILSVSGTVAKQTAENIRAAQITLRGGDVEGVAFLAETKISKKNSMLLSAITAKGTKVSLVQRDTHGLWGTHQVSEKDENGVEKAGSQVSQFLAMFSLLASKPGVATITLSNVKYENYVKASAVTEEVEY